MKILGNKVLVKYEEKKEIKTDSGIVLLKPREDLHQPAIEGEIMAIGNKHNPISLKDLKVGDIILFERSACSIFPYEFGLEKKDNIRYFLIKGVDVLAKKIKRR